ncbi:DUF3379 family protein [Ferrimonas lipolytica]|uniref:DUF3379 domain-containing protein n=1 Tax=Ferrimonas lipolytica TaxID=2724191 RepID=A0A6H1UHG4_9GAMM|nr:DUF3379 family protein [Ferrimonas lipolytica]QIZ77232.1 DUF3379 domain-containing protein [Ferrimonas lipolytica]
MDDLEFRRRLFAEPNSQDPQLTAATSLSEQRSQLRDEVRQLDSKIVDALKIDVPEDLAERLLLRQNLTVHQQSKRRHRWQLAAAASVAFVVGITFTLISQRPDNLGAHAFAHVDHENDFVAELNEHVSLASLNYKMKPLGGQLAALPGDVVYANYCDFQGVRSLHIVMETPQGRVTLFMIPEEGGMNLPSTFTNDKYNGVGVDKHNLHLALVGNKQQELKPVLDELSRNMNAI